jgi:hypothetical protein
VYISRFGVLLADDFAGTSDDSRRRIPPTAYETGNVKYEEGVEEWLLVLGEDVVESRVGKADIITFGFGGNLGGIFGQGM